MEMIETIFLCLPNAFKGTIYQVGKSPGLVAERVTSGLISDNRKEISWGLPDESEYNPPGKPWADYRDQTDRPLEAMAWCVENQKSWTAEDPENDTRSARLRVGVEPEDFYHLEPVLVRKADLNMDMYSSFEYPRNSKGSILWEDSDYIVVAVIKIHFHPHSIRIGSQETKVIKKLSRSLGTELLSYQLHQDSMEAIQEIAKDRLNACNILADSLRNAITKSGLIFSLIKQEIGYLREQWEQLLREELNEKCLKQEGLLGLDRILMEIDEVDDDLRCALAKAHNKFYELSLPPEQGKRWVLMQIEKRWQELLNKYPQKENICTDVVRTIDNLINALHFGKDPGVISKYNKIPEKIKNEWVGLLYRNTDSFDASILDRLIDILGDTQLHISSREKTRKKLMQLKVLGETMDQLERNTNFLLYQVLNGNGGNGGAKSKMRDYSMTSELKEDLSVSV